MGPKTTVHLRIITSLVLITVSTQEQETSNSVNTSKPGKHKSSTSHNVDNQVSRSGFVPSFGPPIPPSDYLQFNSLQHHFDPSLVTNYQYMLSHGYPYAGTYSYNKHTTPFVPSPPDYFLDALQQLPIQKARHSYAEEYLHHYQPERRSEVVPSKPHVFQNVVNYGSISIHHGDHHEPHNNGKSALAHPPSDVQHVQQLAYSSPFSQGYGLPLQHYYTIPALHPYPGLSTEQTQESEDLSTKGEREKSGTEKVKRENT